MYSIYARLRDEKGLTDYAVSKKIGVSRSILSDWKTGKHAPNKDNLKRIAQFFGVSIEYLLTGEISPDSPFALYQQDPEFMGYIQRLWNLPKDYRKAIYKQIGYAERDYQEDLENKRKKEKDLA